MSTAHAAGSVIPRDYIAVCLFPVLVLFSLATSIPMSTSGTLNDHQRMHLCRSLTSLYVYVYVCVRVCVLRSHAVPLNVSPRELTPPYGLISSRTSSVVDIVPDAI